MTRSPDLYMVAYLLCCPGVTLTSTEREGRRVFFLLEGVTDALTTGWLNGAAVSAKAYAAEIRQLKALVAST
jgi:hypothetical protein